MIAQVVVVVALLGAMVVVDLGARRLARGSRREDSLSDGMMVAASAIAVGGGIALALVGGPTWLDGWIVAGAGALVGGAGIVVRRRAIVELARSYTLQLEVEPGQELVTHGLYGRVRHPGYSGLLLQFVGVGIALGGWPSLLAVAPMLLLLPVRIQEEEALLVAAMGEDYRRYRAEVPAIVPHLSLVRPAGARG